MSAPDPGDGMWFKPHRYGYGAFPITWQGWVVVLAFAAAIALTPWIAAEYFDGSFAIQIGFGLILAAVLIIIARAKTRGGWRWRWGDDD